MMGSLYAANDVDDQAENDKNLQFSGREGGHAQVPEMENFLFFECLNIRQFWHIRWINKTMLAELVTVIC